jgi:energy-coupling factor transporter ATP-binding protein EcfA2
MNWNHRPRKILITGKSGSGKTTFYLALLRAWPSRWKFVFDPEREAARKLRWAVAVDVPGLAALANSSRPVCYDPARMFPGDRPQGFAFFSRWVLNVSKLIRGPKLFAVDEIQNVTFPGREGISQAFRELLDLGRREEIDLLMISQRVNEVNHAIRSQLTEAVSFNHSDRLPLEWLEQIGFEPASVSTLKFPGGYIRRNLLTSESEAYAPDSARKASPRKTAVRR